MVLLERTYGWLKGGVTFGIAYAFCLRVSRAPSSLRQTPIRLGPGPGQLFRVADQTAGVVLDQVNLGA